jgi:hypothetical protein
LPVKCAEGRLQESAHLEILIGEVPARSRQDERPVLDAGEPVWDRHLGVAAHRAEHVRDGLHVCG